jgi:hypothetical protein
VTVASPARRITSVVRNGGTKWLPVGAAASMLGGIHNETVRRYADDYLLRSYRMAKGHRRIAEDSVHALAAALDIPPGPDREAALEELRRRNRGDDSAPPEGEKTGGAGQK